MSGAMSLRNETTVVSACFRAGVMLSTISLLVGTPRSVIRMAPASGLLGRSLMNVAASSGCFDREDADQNMVGL